MPGKHLQLKRKASGDANSYSPRSGKHLRKSQKTNADTPDTGKASATQKKSKIGYTRCRESIPSPSIPQVQMHSTV